MCKDATKTYLKLLRNKHILLKGVNLHWKKIGDENVKLIANDLRQNHTVSIVNLSGCRISMNGCNAIDTMLQCNDSIRELDIQGNPNIGDEGIERIAHGLCSNTTITILNATDCTIGPKGCRAIQRMLHVNTSLTQLTLRWNDIGDAGATFIARGIQQQQQQQGTQLMLLDFCHCQIGSKGCKAIADMLLTNTTITEINLGDNPKIDETGIQAIAQALSKNTTVTKLWLSYTDQTKQQHKFATECKFYLMLNRLNRKQCLQAFEEDKKDPTLWMDALIRITKKCNRRKNLQLSCLFYFISKRPEMCKM